MSSVTSRQNYTMPITALHAQNMKQRKAPLTAWSNNVTAILDSSCMAVSGLVEGLTLPLRVITGSSFFRQVSTTQDTFMKRGLLGMVGDGLRLAVGLGGGCLGALIGALVGKDLEGFKNGTNVGRTIGGVFLQAPLEILGGAGALFGNAAANLGGSIAMVLAFVPAVIVGGLLAGVGVGEPVQRGRV